MSGRNITVPVSKLLLDQRNPRLGSDQPDQASTVLVLANKIGSQLLELAEDIQKSGLDPTALFAITGEGAPAGKYRVIEGNRRLLALKALTSPDILKNATISSSAEKKIAKLSSAFRENPIKSLSCVLFEREYDTYHWSKLRHTGANYGIGLVEWGAIEKDRHNAKYDGQRSPAGQVLDFVDRLVPPDGSAKDRFLTTIKRLVDDPDARSLLGIDLSRNVVYSFFPVDEVAKSLSAVVGDLRSGDINVTYVYHKGPRMDYVRSFGPERIPEESTRFNEPVPLSDLLSAESDDSENHHDSPQPSESAMNAQGSAASSSETPTKNGDSGGSAEHQPSSDNRSENSPAPGSNNPSSSGATRSRVKPPRPRTTIVPTGCNLWITKGRINDIYHELRRVDVNDFPNACSVLFRVFFELTVDYHVRFRQLLPESELLGPGFPKRMKKLADYLVETGDISEQLKRTVYKVADGSALGFSSVTFNQYVHNETTYPTPSELRTAWDEIQPFLVELWRK